MKGNKGITLIALVITIIVLLILAAVSIAMLSGENSILNKASESSVANALGAAKDSCALIAAQEVTNYYDLIYVQGNTTGGTYSTTTLDNNILEKITDPNVGVADVKVDKHTTGSKGIKLSYKDGSYVEGTLSNGKITWEAITITKATSKN